MSFHLLIPVKVFSNLIHSNIILSLIIHLSILIVNYCVVFSPTRSPQNGFSCDHGYLSGRGAQKLDTIFRHYYPESGFGWIVLLVAVIVAIIVHGFQLSAIIFLLPTIQRFHVDEVELGE